jgi:hypothetical protein
MNDKLTRFVAVAVDLFEAASGFIGAIGLVVGFMNIPVSVLIGTPFTDFTVPALLLGVVVGGSALVAAVVTAFGSRQMGALFTGAAGCITVGFLTVEIAMIGLQAWPQVVWFLVGVVMIYLGVRLRTAEPRPVAMGAAAA